MSAATPAPYPVRGSDTQAGRSEQFQKRLVEEMKLIPPQCIKRSQGQERRAA